MYDNSNNLVSGAEVRAFSTKYGTTNNYIVAYDDPAFPSDTSKLTYGPGTATSSTGRFFVMNVDPDDVVVVTAIKDKFIFNMRTYDTYADSVMQGRITGQAIPTISGFSPQSGLPGDTITINGTNFSTSSNQVCFNSFCTSASYNSSGEVRVSLPCGAQSGPLSVTVNGLTATAATGFTVPAPTISGFTPSQGPVGATVTITGTNFNTCGSPYGMSASFYNNSYANVTVNSPTQMTVLVPFNAATGPISVMNNIGMATGNTFTVLPPPSMTTASPNGGPPGLTVTVSGTFYDLDKNNYEVSFNGSPRDVILGVTANSLTFATPADISTYSTYMVKYYGQQYFIYNGFVLWNLLSTTIVGNGSVNDVSGSHFSCTYAETQPCTKYFDPTTILNLTPSHSDGYLFQGWDAGCVSGLGPNDCSFNMTGPVSRTATFVPDTSLPGYISGTTVYRSSLQGVYDYFATNGPFPQGTVIQLTAGELNGNFSAGSNATVTVKDGYESGFGSPNASTTTLHVTDKLTISKGKVVFERIKIK